MLSWITGWINVSGWVTATLEDAMLFAKALQIALVASGGLLGSQLIVGAISLYNTVGIPLIHVEGESAYGQ